MWRQQQQHVFISSINLAIFFSQSFVSLLTAAVTFSSSLYQSNRKYAQKHKSQVKLTQDLQHFTLALVASLFVDLQFWSQVRTLDWHADSQGTIKKTVT